jgi:ATP-dependent RNA helicase DeaD
VETEEREERGSGRSQNVVHTLPRSMASVPRFLTGPLERIDPSLGDTQVLVVTADAETAMALAEAVLRMTGPAGIELLPITTSRRATRMMAGRPVLAAAGSPGDIRDLVRGSHLKLDGIKSVVLAWADEILAGDQEDVDALEAVMAELPKEAARIVVTGRAEGRVNAFAERYLRRAHRDLPADADEALAPVPLQYVTVSAGSRLPALRRLLDDLDPPSAAVVVSGDDSETAVSNVLRMLGYPASSAAVRVTRGEIEPSTNAVIFYDAPATRAQLAAAAAAAPVTIVALAEPREVKTLQRIAGAGVRPFTLSAPGNAAREREAAMRRELSAVLDSGVASREVLALEPMLERYDGLDVAAAALRLLEKERTLRKAAQDDARAKQEVAARAAPARPFERSASGGRSAAGPRDSRGPRSGGPSGRGPSPRGPSPRGSSSRGSSSRGSSPRGSSPRGDSRPPKRDRS